ncbi:MAG: hypothetical protein A3H42_02590 [Deltaproteobacteria bacterium RIFCSPLOWO2_02_FULL_46_8]|nr:MAG: hypothetical protein A3H42_02590 [Deltaproteobacteria bacterium RIFCSPLOWO2_02_FULL_46_8]
MTKVEQGKGENVKKYILAGFILLAGCGGGTGAPEVNQATSTSTTTATETPKPDSPVTEESKKTEPLPEKDQPPVTSTKEPEKKDSPPPENIDQTIKSPVYLLYIYGQDDRFLGFVNTNKFDSYSICNQFGSYGNKFSSTSMWNQFGSYGSDFGSLSAFNDFTNSPPILYAQEINGNTVIPLYYISTNELKIPRIDSLELLSVLQANGCSVER